MGGGEKTDRPSLTLEEGVRQVLRLRDEGMPVKEAARQVAEATGLRKNQLYQLAAQEEKYK